MPRANDCSLLMYFPRILALYDSGARPGSDGLGEAYPVLLIVTRSTGALFGRAHHGGMSRYGLQTISRVKHVVTIAPVYLHPTPGSSMSALGVIGNSNVVSHKYVLAKTVRLMLAKVSGLIIANEPLSGVRSVRTGPRRRRRVFLYTSCAGANQHRRPPLSAQRPLAREIRARYFRGTRPICRRRDGDRPVRNIQHRFYDARTIADDGRGSGNVLRLLVCGIGKRAAHGLVVGFMRVVSLALGTVVDPQLALFRDDFSRVGTLSHQPRTGDRHEHEQQHSRWIDTDWRTDFDIRYVFCWRLSHAPLRREFVQTLR